MKHKNLIFMLLFGFILFQNASSKKTMAPDFSLYDLDKKIVRLSSKEFDNQIIILNFFATWCPPCKMEIPGFVKFFKSYKNKDVKLIGICLDVDNIERIKKFIELYEINYPILIGTREVVNSYGGIRAIPTTFILNHKREISDKIIGYLEEKQLKEIVDKLIQFREAEKEGKK